MRHHACARKHAARRGEHQDGDHVAVHECCIRQSLGVRHAVTSRRQQNAPLRDHDKSVSCKKKVSLEEPKAQKEHQFLRRRQIAFMICDYFRVTGAHDTVLDYADLFSVTLHDDNFQEFDTRWDEVQQSMSKIPSDDTLESLYKLRIRESVQLKTVRGSFSARVPRSLSPTWKKKVKNRRMKRKMREKVESKEQKGES